MVDEQLREVGGRVIMNDCQKRSILVYTDSHKRSGGRVERLAKCFTHNEVSYVWHGNQRGRAFV